VASSGATFFLPSSLKAAAKNADILLRIESKEPGQHEDAVQFWK
jgi:hypothetical protein